MFATSIARQFIITNHRLKDHKQTNLAHDPCKLVAEFYVVDAPPILVSDGLTSHGVDENQSADWN